MVWSSCNDGMAALDNSIEGDRDHSMVAATTTRATTAIAETLRRIMGSSRFLNCEFSADPRLDLRPDTTDPHWQADGAIVSRWVRRMLPRQAPARNCQEWRRLR